MIHLSDHQRWVQRTNPANVMRSADTQSVHEPDKLIDFEVYRERERQKQLERGYRNRHPHTPRRPRPAA